MNRLRNHRRARAGIIRELLEMVVEQCIAHGSVKVRYVSAHGTQVDTNTSIARFEPVKVEETIGEYLEHMGSEKNEERPRCTRGPSQPLVPAQPPAEE